jgi:serine/threonine protein kinase
LEVTGQPDDTTLERIGGYRVIRRIATGGTSDVLLARAEGPLGFGRTVVLKRLLSEYQHDDQFSKMFAREASAYARLSHPAIVRLFDFFSLDGRLVMVLEFVDGLPLNRLRASLRGIGHVLDDRAAIYVASRIFAALAAAHNARDTDTGEFAPVIHRDVNPSNVLIPWDGHVKLGDFGIAKVAGVPSDTQVGLIKGTYGYMAPEQVKGEAVTIRADVYAGALVLWELLARRKAIQRGALPEMEVLRAMAEPSLVTLDILRPDIDKGVRDAVRRGLEPHQDKRAITADEMLTVLKGAVKSDLGRQSLVDAMALVKPIPSSDIMAPTESKPDQRSDPSQGDTVPNRPAPSRPGPRPAAPSMQDADADALAKAFVSLSPASASPARGIPRPGSGLAPPRPRSAMESQSDKKPQEAKQSTLRFGSVTAPAAAPPTNPAGALPRPRPRSRARRAADHQNRRDPGDRPRSYAGAPAAEGNDAPNGRRVALVRARARQRSGRSHAGAADPDDRAGRPERLGPPADGPPGRAVHRVGPASVRAARPSNARAPLRRRRTPRRLDRHRGRPALGPPAPNDDPNPQPDRDARLGPPFAERRGVTQTGPERTRARGVQRSHLQRGTESDAKRDSAAESNAERDSGAESERDPHPDSDSDSDPDPDSDSDTDSDSDSDSDSDALPAARGGRRRNRRPRDDRRLPEPPHLRRRPRPRPNPRNPPRQMRAPRREARQLGQGAKRRRALRRRGQRQVARKNAQNFCAHCSPPRSVG